MTKDPNESGELPENVVRGPWKNKAVKQPDIDMIQVQDNLAFIDDLTQQLMVSMIHQMGENGIDVSEKAFIRDMALTIEIVKSTLYRDFGYKHPLQAFTKTFVDVTIEPDNTPIGEVQLETLETFVNQFEDDDDGPKIS
tara:strand:- start:1025 stop:1441 length:417 start_codon:yes stop_codon:yes gene_type:complete